MVTVFISYSRSDEQLASRLYKDLRTRDLEVWFDKESLITGQDWERAIQEAIYNSDFVVLLLSNTSVGKRGYFQNEVKITLDVLQTIPFGHIYLLPVRLEACQIPAQLSAVHCADLFPDWDRGLEKLLKAIEIQSGIQFSARCAEQDQARGNASILLVNDNPAMMNFAVDVWKSHGLKVEYAFNVQPAIQAIQKAPQMIVVSDLSHFSFGQLVTDRAGFEILEWARGHKRDIRLIVSTSNLTQERRDEARRLGAIGICDNHTDLHQMIAKETGLSISLPNEVSGRNEIRSSMGLQGSAGDSIEIAKRGSPRVFLFGATCDGSFTVRLLRDLITRGFGVSGERWRISSWNSGGCRVFDNFDFAIVVVSREATTDSFYQYGAHTLIEEREGYGVISVVLDDDAVKYISTQAQKVQYVDFRRDYDEALSQLVECIRRLYEAKAKP
jgi:CheY-like chemotaxis protein